MLDVKDKACAGECPVDCIYEGERVLYIHPDECVECGTCEPVCPVEAIFCEDDVPERWAQFTAENASFFDPRRVQDRAATLRHRLCRQLHHQLVAPPCPDPDTQTAAHPPTRQPTE